EDPHNTTLTHTIDPASTDTKYKTYVPTISERLDVLVLDDENPGVFVLESDGTTLLTACGATCGTPGAGDNYLLRLNSQPTAIVKIGIITDGQVDVNKAAVDGTRVKLEQVGGLQASQAFKGNISFSGGVITRANGS